MTTARFGRVARDAALVLGVLVALLGSTALAGTQPVGPGHGTHVTSASAAVTAPASAAARIAERLGSGLRPAQDHPLPPAVHVTALLLVGGLLLLASLPPGRPLQAARGQRSTPARAPPMAA